MNGKKTNILYGKFENISIIINLTILFINFDEQITVYKQLIEIYKKSNHNLI